MAFQNINFDSYAELMDETADVITAAGGDLASNDRFFGLGNLLIWKNPMVFYAVETYRSCDELLQAGQEDNPSVDYLIKAAFRAGQVYGQMLSSGSEDLLKKQMFEDLKLHAEYGGELERRTIYSEWAEEWLAIKSRNPKRSDEDTAALVNEKTQFLSKKTGKAFSNKTIKRAVKKILVKPNLDNGAVQQSAEN